MMEHRLSVCDVRLQREVVEHFDSSLGADIHPASPFGFHPHQ